MSSSQIQRPKNFRALGGDRVPAGGFLLIPSRLGGEELDALEEWFAGRPLEYLVEEGALEDPEIANRMAREGVASSPFDPSEDDAARSGLRERIRGVTDEGGVLVFVPAPAVAQPATSCRVRPASLRALLAASTRVLPLFVDQPGEILLSVESPAGAAVRGGFAFGTLLEGDRLTLATFQEVMLAAAEDAFSQCPRLECHL